MLNWKRSTNGTLYTVVDSFIVRIYRSQGQQKISLVFRGELETEAEAKSLAEEIVREHGLLGYFAQHE